MKQLYSFLLIFVGCFHLKGQVKLTYDSLHRDTCYILRVSENIDTVNVIISLEIPHFQAT